VNSGHTASCHPLAAYAPDDPWLTPEDVRGEDLSVRGVVAYYALSTDFRIESKARVKRGPIEDAIRQLLIRLLERWSHSKVPSPDEWNAQFVGGQRADWVELYCRVSPITRVEPDSPPTLQFMGQHDVYVCRDGAIPALHRRLQAAGVPSVYVELPQTDHAFDMFLPQFSPAAQAAMYDTDRFLALMASSCDPATQPMPQETPAAVVRGVHV
jgi:acetyl esterase/lipase